MNPNRLPNDITETKKNLSLSLPAAFMYVAVSCLVLLSSLQSPSRTHKNLFSLYSSTHPQSNAQHQEQSRKAEIRRAPINLFSLSSLQSPSRTHKNLFSLYSWLSRGNSTSGYQADHSPTSVFMSKHGKFVENLIKTFLSCTCTGKCLQKF